MSASPFAMISVSSIARVRAALFAFREDAGDRGDATGAAAGGSSFDGRSALYTLNNRSALRLAAPSDRASDTTSPARNEDVIAVAERAGSTLQGAG